MRLGAILPIAAAAALSLAGEAVAAPLGGIDCPVLSLSPKVRMDLGAKMIDGSEAVRVQDAIARPATACATAHRWTAAQTEAATMWGVWEVMIVELERRSGLAPADLAIMHAYVDEDPSRVAGMDRFTSAQVSALIVALRQRGAHLHDMGNETEREIGFLMVIKELKQHEAEFAHG